MEGKKKDPYKDVYSSCKHEIEHRILWYKTKKPFGLSIWHVRPACKEEVIKYALCWGEVCSQVYFQSNIFLSILDPVY